jgi:hypothetical protein
VDSLVTDRIRGLLEHKIRFLKEILAGSEVLAELPYESHETEYSNLLKARQRYLDSLQNLEPTLREYWKAIEETAISQEHHEQIRLLNDKASYLIQQILMLDCQKKSAFSQEMQQIKGKLRAVRQGRRGIAGYQAGQRMSIAGAFTDNRK